MPRISYEWTVLEMEEEGEYDDIEERISFPTLREALAWKPPPGCVVNIELCRDVWTKDGESFDDRQFASLDMLNWTLPDCFDAGAIVPRRFHEEVRRNPLVGKE